MGLAPFLKRIVDTLDRCQIAHMVAGSLASTHHGRPRTTHDVDMVIDADIDRVRRFVRALPADEYYVSEEAAVDAVRRRSMFNVIDLTSGWKVDLIIRKDRSFSRAEFSRRQPASMLGVDVFVASAEDTILSKLEWARMSPSDRQLGDVAAVIEVVGEELDTAYIERWARGLGVDELWRQVSGGIDIEE